MNQNFKMQQKKLIFNSKKLIIKVNDFVLGHTCNNKLHNFENYKTFGKVISRKNTVFKNTSKFTFC